MMDDGIEWMIRRGGARREGKKKNGRGDKIGKRKTRCYVIK